MEGTGDASRLLGLCRPSIETARPGKPFHGNAPRPKDRRRALQSPPLLPATPGFPIPAVPCLPRRRRPVLPDGLAAERRPRAGRTAPLRDAVTRAAFGIVGLPPAGRRREPEMPAAVGGGIPGNPTGHGGGPVARIHAAAVLGGVPAPEAAAQRRPPQPAGPEDRGRGHRRARVALSGRPFRRQGHPGGGSGRKAGKGRRRALRTDPPRWRRLTPGGRGRNGRRATSAPSTRP